MTIKLIKCLLFFYMIAMPFFSKSKGLEISENQVNKEYSQIDTIKFLKENIIKKKELYLKRPLKNLLDNIPFEIKSFLAANEPGNILESDNLYLTFYNAKDAFEKRLDNKEKVIELIVVWDIPFSWPKIVELIKKDKGEWTKEVKEYFENGIVKEILLPKYLTDK